MKKAVYSFELPEHLVQKKRDRILHLKENPRVLDFLAEHQLPLSIVESQSSLLSNWLDERDRISSLTRQDIQQYPLLGQYTDLRVENGQLIEYVAKHPLLIELEQQKDHEKNFKMNDIPDNLRSVSFNAVNILEESNDDFLNAFDIVTSFNPKQNGQGIFLYGKPGVGKTYLMACLANQLAKEGFTVAFVNVPTLMGTIKRNFDNNPEIRRIMTELNQVRFLVLDDIGAELITSYNRDEILLPILNARLESNRMTLFTSNYDLDALLKQYQTDTYGKVDEIRSERILSRIRAMVVPVVLTGNDRRNRHNP